MEVFTGDHDVVLYSDTHFPPFSLPTSDTFSDHHNHFPPPPQKLRPIRCNLRTTETHAGGLIPPKSSDLGLPVTECQVETALSSCSSDETSKLQEPMKEPVNKKKRKRKTRRKLELFMESMMKTVIEKQEEMYKQLTDMLEQKEKERIMREQAWKKQEIERAKRYEQARKQQESQTVALISFIQNTLGQDIQIPNFDKQNDDHDREHDRGRDIEMDNTEEFEYDTGTKRWPKSEVQALITVRAAMNHKFNGKGSKSSIWEEVAAGLSGMGYNRTPKKCKEKWENINKYYRRTTEKGKESKTCKYFGELEMLHRTGCISANSHDEDHSVKVLALEYK